MKKILLTTTFLIICLSAIAQQGFKYQAVVRDNNGDIVANQAVQFQMNIILETIANTPTYVETHTITTNAFGVVNFNIGTGTIISGDFETIDWEQDAFIKIQLDITGGTNYTDMGTSEIVAVPKAMYASKAKQTANRYGIYVTDFGAIGDEVADDTQAFQDAIDSAAVLGSKVFVPVGNYRIYQTLVIPAGVTIVGEGIGTNPLQVPTNGSNLHYHGNAFAIEMTGHDSGLRDLVVIDKGGNANGGGVLINADGRLIESLRFFNVLLSNYISGTALKLYAANGGGLFYSSFYNVRVRNAKVGIHIHEDGTNAYVNSNTFHHGAISGGGFDKCLWVAGGNNNKFYGTIMEPYTSNDAHVMVDSGEVQCYDIRIEGISQPWNVPLVHLKEASQHCHFDGLYSGGTTIDEGNNQILFRSGKGNHYVHSDENMFENAIFNGFDGTELPYWTITGTGVTLDIESPELTPEHNVLKITVPAGVECIMTPHYLHMPESKNRGMYEELSFGCYMKTNVAQVAFLTTRAPVGLTTSQYHLGDNDWHFIGTMNPVDLTQLIEPKIRINNTTGSAIVVYISVPTFNFGMKTPKIDPKPITSAGGIVTGTLSTSFYEIDAVPANGFLVLPKYGNVFEINGTQDIYRINHINNDRFPKGTMVTLLFNDAGLGIGNSAYINLISAYTSTANSSLTLISNGDGTWREISRNL